MSDANFVYVLVHGRAEVEGVFASERAAADHMRSKGKERCAHCDGVGYGASWMCRNCGGSGVFDVWDGYDLLEMEVWGS